ncbi:MAG TPA: hypothetical protein ENN54_02335 [Thermoplasmatales archaeon]|nr:hypothetical protein [Thermoplasmatales archaeon]
MNAKFWFVGFASVLMLALSVGGSLHTSVSPRVAPSVIVADDDLDPLVDLEVSVDVQRARKIDGATGQPSSFSVRVTVGDESWESPLVQGFDVWDIGTAWFDVPDDQALVPVTIEVLEGGEVMDISPQGDSFAVTYDLRTGGWSGDDYLGDPSGYGHASGTEDGESTHRDYEIWFQIGFNDYDGDGLTYWEEVNVYQTDPEQNDAGIDYDGDGVPIEWEDHWGYDPFAAEDHHRLDPDRDGLQNTEEYMMGQWLADPFRQGIYIENDYMEPHNGITPLIPQESLQLQYSSFTKHHIMLLVDDGLMGGSDILPYREMSWDDYEDYYTDYFLHGDPDNPRRGVFHWALIIHDANRMFGRGVGGFNFMRDSFAICSAYIQRWRPWEEGSVLGHGGSYMHELGHQLGLDHLRCFPWQPLYWISGSYRSCMNYRYNYKIVDYSDGTHGFMDRDEWSQLDLARFQR